MNYDLIVIGGGPAGYVAAIRASQLGKKVVCVEREKLGGTCLNWGCIPTKALLKNAHLYHKLKKHGNEFGLSFDNLKFDSKKIIKRSRNISDRLNKGIGFLLKKNKVNHLVGEASIIDENTIEVLDSDSKKTIVNADSIIIATGGASKSIPNLTYDGDKIINSKDALQLDEFPQDLLIVGAGAIGIEFADFYNALDCKVTVLEMLPRILINEDEEVSNELEKILKRKGIDICCETVIDEININEKISIKTKGKKSFEKQFDKILVAVGVSPNVPNSKINIELDRGFIKVNENYQTNYKNIYAVGDVNGPPLLAHMASKEAIEAVEYIFENKEVDVSKKKLVPACTYSSPEVASVGMNEQELKEKNINYTVGKFPMMASGRALASGETKGFSKLLFDKESGEILGAHLLCENASDMLSEIILAIDAEYTNHEIESLIHPHPTLSETIMEAAAVSLNKAIHA